ncbi:MAG: Hsp70 family protein [Dehalococcoidia bacterium]|nr:Hsp70 family protein [Dehalococcoidia bacterium]
MEKGHKQIQFEFLPLTLSIETLGGISTPLVKRGTLLPTERSQTFSTAADNQESVEIKVLFGERPLASKNLVLGSCLLEDILPAPKGQAEIVVTFKVDKYCGVTVEAVEKKSGRKIEAKLIKEQLTLTNETVDRMIAEARKNQQEDEARSLITSAEWRIRKDQEGKKVTETTRKIESMVSEIGIALMNGDAIFIAQKTKELEKLLAKPLTTYTDFGFADLFSGFSPSRTTRRVVKPQQKAAPSKVEKPEPKNSLAEVSTPTTTFVQSFLESVDPELELKRLGAWEALNSNRPESRVQATHSMRELLRLLLDKLSPAEKVQKASWYNKPDSGASITRAMKIRYAIAGDSNEISESTFNLIRDMSAAVDSMYAKLSAQSHTEKKTTITATRMYLIACETIVGLIASARL